MWIILSNLPTELMFSQKLLRLGGFAHLNQILEMLKFIGAFVSGGTMVGIVGLSFDYFKWNQEKYLSSDKYWKGLVAGHMSTRQQFQLEDYPLIQHPRLMTKIKQANSYNRGKLGSLYVLYAPEGSEKSTYLRSYACHYIEHGGKAVVVDDKVRSLKDLGIRVGLPEEKAEKVFDYFPDKALIILDQVENVSIRIRSALVASETATITRKLFVLLDFKANVLKKMIDRILMLNGGDKIRKL